MPKDLAANAPGGRLPSIPGSVPALTQIPPGCPFHPRCPFAMRGRCDVGGPPLEVVEPGHAVACVPVRSPSS